MPEPHSTPTWGRGQPEPSGTDAFFVAVMEVLSHGPLTPFGLERTIERLWPRFLHGRRGYVHAALLQLRRRGVVTAGWMDTPRGPRRVFSAGRSAGAATPPEPVSHDAGPERLVRIARKMTRRLDFAPGLHTEVQRDVLHHLMDAVAALRDSGVPDGDATKEVVSDFGDPWRIRTDLARIAQGRRTVLFPRNLKETLAGLATYDAGILLCIVGAILFLRLEVFTAYHIPTRSMEPTLHGDRRDGDRILVNRLAPAPDRFRITVFDGWGAERKNYVKRCVGLPNETLRLREGDVYVDGRLIRKYGDVYEALLFPLYAWDDLWRRANADNPDDRQAAHEQVFDEQFDLWENVSGKWVLDTRRGYNADRPKDGERAILRWRETVHDDLYDATTGDVEGGSYTCPDLRLTADLTLSEKSTEVVLHLSRGATAYEAVIAADHVELLVGDSSLARVEGLDLAGDDAIRVRFAQVDRVLRLDVADQEIVHELPQPEFPKRAAAQAQVDFRVRGGSAWVKPVALERDVFYTPDYLDDGVVLGPDDFYMLGDNSGNSHDSRRNGPAHRSRLVGRPILIVWPPKRWRFPR